MSLPDVLRDAYGLTDLALEPLAGGQRGQVWRSGPRVVKAYDLRRVDHYRVAGALRLQAALAEQGLPVAPVIKTSSGHLWAELGEGYVAVMGFVEGVRKVRGTLTVAEAAALGALVARLHTALAALAPGVTAQSPDPARSRRRWEEVLSGARSGGDAFDREAAALAAYALEALDRLPAPDWSRQGAQLCHMDLHLDNILWAGAEPVAILDFDNAQGGWPLAEALTVWNLSLCPDPARPEWGEAAEAFFAAYGAGGPVRDPAAWAEAPLVYWHMLMASTWPAGHRYRDPATFRPEWAEALAMRAGGVRWAEANGDRFAR